MRQTPSQIARIGTVLAIVALALQLVAPAALAQGRVLRGWTLTVTHGPVTMTLADAGSDGHRAGDQRVTSVATADEDGDPVGRLDAILTTTAIDIPGPGDEIRISTLVFSFGDGTDQLVVTGTGVYPAAGATIADSSSVIRPLVGGSGRYAGATGWTETEHLDDGTWRHTFHVGGTGMSGIPVDPDGAPRVDPDADASPGTDPTAGTVRTLPGAVDPATAPAGNLAL
jgi:hypothetical protein